MKYLFPSLIVMILFSAALESCAPTPSGIDPVTMIHTKYRFPTTNPGGILNSTADTNIYDFSLSCGCAFLLRVEGADTSSIRYDTTNFADTTVSHKIKAAARAGLASGQHTGWLAIATIQPVTTELFRDTLRDTIVVP